MWAKPTKKDLERMEKAFKRNQETGREDDTLILGHFFMGGNDWYISEYNPETEIMFGYAILNGDYQMSEWGTVLYDGDDEESKANSLMGLKVAFMEVDFDKGFKPVKWSVLKKELDAKFA